MSQSQYGFPRDHFMVDAISMVLSLVKNPLNSGGCCAVLALDVKNLFNSANWGRIEGALADVGVSRYLVSLVGKYLSEKTLGYGTDEGPKEYIVIVGVSQGSMPCTMCANVLPLVIAAKHPEHVEAYAMDTVGAEKNLAGKARVDLGKWKNQRESGLIVVFKPAIEYQGVIIEW